MDEKKFRRLPDSERTVMQIIWAMDKAGCKDIYAGAMFDAYPDRIGHLKLTTVLTLITRLYTKGFIAVEKRGRANCYTPLVDEDEYNRNAAAEFVATVYEGNGSRFLSALWDGGVITGEDVEKLREQIANSN